MNTQVNIQNTRVVYLNTLTGGKNTLDCQLRQNTGEGFNYKWKSAVQQSDDGVVFGYYNEEKQVFAINSEADNLKATQWMNEMPEYAAKLIHISN